MIQPQTRNHQPAPTKTQKSIGLFNMKKTLVGIVRKFVFFSKIHAVSKLVKNKNYLVDEGWFESFRKQMPVDKYGQAIPWYTYAAIRFLAARVGSNMNVFEFGSGNSTIWWGRHTLKVVSCEHNEQWYRVLKLQLPENVEYLYCQLEPGGEYSKAANRKKEKFHIIIIDGRDRVNCLKNSLSQLTEDGVVIWDNSDRKKYQEGFDYLAINNFKKIDFYGFGPINSVGWCTTIFYKTNNCLGI